MTELPDGVWRSIFGNLPKSDAANLAQTSRAFSVHRQSLLREGNASFWLRQRGHESHESASISISCSPDGRHLAICFSDGSCSVWCWNTFKRIRQFSLPGSHTEFTSISLYWELRDGELVVASWTPSWAPSPIDKTIFVGRYRYLGTQEPKEILSSFTLPINFRLPSSLQLPSNRTPPKPGSLSEFSPNGQYLVAFSITGSWSSLHLRAPHTEFVSAPNFPSRPIRDFRRDLKFWPGKQDTAAVLGDGSIRSLNLHTLSVVPAEVRFPNKSITAFEFSPDGQSIAVLLCDGSLQLLNADSLRTNHTWSSEGQRITAFEFSPDGQSIAALSENGVLRLLNLSTGNENFILNDESKPVDWFTFSPSGQVIAAVIDDGSIVLLNMCTGATIHALKNAVNNIQWLAFSPNGQHLVVAMDPNPHAIFGVIRSKLIVLQVSTGAILHTL
ncbi:MAG: WD40 repeat domain-containing protein [Myxococcota bacterium]